MPAAATVKVDLEVAKNLGLTEEEYHKIVAIMGRVPNFNELSIFSVMWSEHCSYKNSIMWLKTLPARRRAATRRGGRRKRRAGGHRRRIGLRLQDRKPQPPQCIGTLPGGRNRRGGHPPRYLHHGRTNPSPSLNSLRFGDPELPHTRHLVDGVVRGIGDYGNCFGVPVVGGEVVFHPSYNQNILVNAMSVGIVKHGETVSASADGPGNPVFIVGSATGKDGIHGATFSSADLTEDSAEDLPAVQVGDPFQEKLLLEASLEVITTRSGSRHAGHGRGGHHLLDLRECPPSRVPGCGLT